MVGSISNPVDTNTIVSVPPGLRGSNWYGYAPAGYVPVAQIVPGKGYWIRSNGAGKFVLSNPLSGPARVQTPDEGLADLLHTLTITDARGGSQTLYFGVDDEKVVVSEFDMPPIPPIGAFDARFESAEGGSMVRTHAAGITGPTEFIVEVQSDSYPLTVTWNVKEGTTLYELTDGVSGRLFTSRSMRGTGSIEITNNALNRFSIRLAGGGELPKEFALAQNYPNPFNPSTTIKYDLPTDTHVRLTLFNVLGQNVATLVDEDQRAGYRSVDWNASHVASGIYFYRLEADKFVQTRKLILLR
jgi:hypothetical protein